MTKTSRGAKTTTKTSAKGKTATKKAAPKKATPKKATPKKATPKKATPKKKAAKKATPKKKAAKKATPKKATPKKATPKKATPKKKAAKKATPKKATPKKATPKKKAAKKPTAKKPTAKKKAATKATAEKKAAKKPSPEKKAAKKASKGNANKKPPPKPAASKASKATANKKGTATPKKSARTGKKNPALAFGRADQKEVLPAPEGLPVAAHPDAGLDQAQVEFLFRALTAERTRVIAGFDRHLQEALEDRGVMPDETDMAQRSTEQAYLIRFADKERKLLREIDRALDKLRTAEYGVCEGTEEPVGFERLRVRPWTRYSVAYKEQIERDRSQHRR